MKGAPCRPTWLGPREGPGSSGEAGWDGGDGGDGVCHLSTLGHFRCTENTVDEEGGDVGTEAHAGQVTPLIGTRAGSASPRPVGPSLSPGTCIHLQFGETAEPRLWAGRRDGGSSLPAAPWLLANVCGAELRGCSLSCKPLPPACQEGGPGELGPTPFPDRPLLSGYPADA